MPKLPLEPELSEVRTIPVRDVTTLADAGRGVVEALSITGLLDPAASSSSILTTETCDVLLLATSFDILFKHTQRRAKTVIRLYKASSSISKGVREISFIVSVME